MLCEPDLGSASPVAVVCTSGDDDEEEDDEEEGAGGIALETLNASAGHVRDLTQLK